MPEIKKYLNRDGLEDYNSLLPHSAGAMQEYVDAWLDEHPEATTTVQDGSVTAQKLADASVTRNKLAEDLAHLLGGMMITKEVQGETLTVDDAYAIAPLSMTIDGKSTQDGTPTPENPIPIENLEVLELPVTFIGKNLIDFSQYTWTNRQGFIPGTLVGTTGAIAYSQYYKSILDFIPCSHIAGKNVVINPKIAAANYATVAFYSNDDEASYISGSAFNARGMVPENAKYMRVSLNLDTATDKVQIEYGSVATSYEPYAGVSAQIPMHGNVLRGLPDGTCDTIELSYLRESNRAGWAWYSAELVQRVGTLDLGAQTWSRVSASGTTLQTARISTMPNVTSRAAVMCDIYAAQNSAVALEDKQIKAQNNYNRIWIRDDAYDELTPADFKASLNGIYALYPLATPITTQLTPIELPILPAPNYTIWSDPTTGLKMSYMCNSSIVIANIEQAIADQ